MSPVGSIVFYWQLIEWGEPDTASPAGLKKVTQHVLIEKPLLHYEDDLQLSQTLNKSCSPCTDTHLLKISSL